VFFLLNENDIFIAFLGFLSFGLGRFCANAKNIDC